VRWVDRFALQSFRCRLLDVVRYRPVSSSPGIRCPFRVFCPSKYRAYGLARSRFVVGPCLGCTVFLRWGPLIVVQGNQFHPLFEFRVPPEALTVNPSRPAATGRLLSWAFVPFSTCRYRRSTCCELAALTGFRLQGLATLLAVCSLRSLAGPVSGRQRSWDFPFGAVLPSGFSDVSIRSKPTCRFSCRCSWRYIQIGPAGRDFWAFARRRFLSADAGLVRSPGGDSLGFRPFQGIEPKASIGISPVLLSRAFVGCV